MQKKDYHVAIVGASGAVGQELLDVLERRRFPVRALRMLGSERSAGTSTKFRGETIPIELLDENSFAGIDLALFSAGAGISRRFAPAAVRTGAVVVDNSSAFRLDEEVPLVIPEINGADAATHRGIIANPNCTTAVTLMALAPLHRAFGVKRIFASSYQAVSGTGAKAIEELRTQVQAIANGREAVPSVYPHTIAFNIWSGPGAKQAPAGSAGLRWFTIVLPDDTTLDDVRARLTAHHYGFDEIAGGIEARDPSGNLVKLVVR